jgi:hypothetical protein
MQSTCFGDLALQTGRGKHEKCKRMKKGLERTISKKGLSGCTLKHCVYHFPPAISMPCMHLFTSVSQCTLSKAGTASLEQH